MVRPDITATPWMAPAERAEMQSGRLAWMYSYAWDSCPFYRRLWRQHGLGPDSIQGVDDLPALPITDRDMLLHHTDEIRVADEVLYDAVTGGTTGHRFRWAYSESWVRLFWDCWFRGLAWAGLTIDLRLLVVSIFPAARDAFPVAINFGEPIDPRHPEERLAQIDEFAPEAIYGWCSHAHVLARTLLARGRRLPLKACVMTSEPLPLPWRDTLEEAFECKVFDNFGCNDGGVWGAQCGLRDGFHHDVERSVLEFDGTRMLGTDLWNTAFPFFRYRTGDEGEWVEGACACGRTSPRFRVHGRATDMIHTPGGPAGPTYVSTVFLYPGVDSIRIVQRALDDVELLYVPNERFDEAEFAAAVERLGKALFGLRPVPRAVEEIPPTLSGKHRVSINLMD